MSARDRPSEELANIVKVDVEFFHLEISNTCMGAYERGAINCSS